MEAGLDSRLDAFRKPGQFHAGDPNKLYVKEGETGPRPQLSLVGSNSLSS